MPVINIMGDEFIAYFDPVDVKHLSLVICNGDKRIQTVIILKFDEAHKLLEAIKGYREAKWLNDSMPNQPKQMDLPDGY